MPRLVSISVLVVAVGVSVGALSVASAEPDRRADEHSYAEPTRVRVRDLALDLTVIFGAKQLAGTATLAVDWIDPAYATLVLDTRDLRIAKVEGEVGPGRWKRLPYQLAKRDAIFGSALTIQAARAAKVRITYKTMPQASGLQWLPAKLTANGKRPFLFSQSQAIHARSWIPLQDTPGVRFTYTARIRTPKDVIALMSAADVPESPAAVAAAAPGLGSPAAVAVAPTRSGVVRDGDYHFTMGEPIPSYLLAIAVGDLAFKPISERSGVWAEPTVVDRGFAEFADTEKMILATEALYGPYRWGRYDLLLLPASFPFGGMENPRLSFITPTVLVGDKSLVSLIAHELAHSWSGNLVTNASWKDVWLNEGFTTYVENRVVEALYGRDFAEMESVLGQNSLRERMLKVPAAQQRLRLPALPGLDPDEATGDVAYDKGRWFLITLEHRFGRPLFDPFLRRWFERQAFKSVTTDDFVAYLRTELLAKRPGVLTEAELRDWIDGEGIPKSAVATASARFTAVDRARARWLDKSTTLAGLGTAGMTTWSTQERVHFLEGMPPTLSATQLAELDAAMKLTGTQNGELAERWYPLTIRSGYVLARPALAAFVERVGRRKLVMPIYEALVVTPDGLAFAKQTFARAKAGYHPITAASVRGLLAAARPSASPNLARPPSPPAPLAK